MNTLVLNLIEKFCMFNIIDPLIKLQQADKKRLLFVKVISEFISCLHWKVKIERETCYDLNLEEQKVIFFLKWASQKLQL